MKKYPFSKKAVKAILAASIALTPLASVGANPVAAATVSSPSYDSITTLENYLQSIYNESSAATQTNLNAVSDAVEQVTDSEWSTIVQNLNITDQQGQPVSNSSKIAIAKYLLSFIYTVTPDALQRTQYQYQDNAQLDADIQAILGANVTNADLFNYAVDVQTEIVEAFLSDDLTVAELRSMTDQQYKELITEAVAAASSQTDNFDLSLKLFNSFDLSNYATLKNQVNAVVGSELNVRDIFATAVAEYKTSQGGGNNGGGSGGSGGGGSTTSPGNSSNNGGVKVDSGKISENASEVAKAIKDAKEFKNLEITLSNKAQDVSLPPAVLKAIIEKNKEATIDVKTAAGSYSLPASQINLADLAKELGGTADDVNIKITVKVGKDDKDVLGKNKLTAVSDVVEFTVEADVKGNKKELKTFKTYVDRTIQGKEEFDADKSVALRLEEDGSFTALPTYFTEDEAKVKSMTNSQYVVVENEKTFNDLSTAWNKEQIEKLASKYIVQGRPDGSFGPYATTTRVQLAVLLTRALGLSTDAAYDNSFKDVKGDEWFVPEVTAAVNAGIIQGKVDGSFDPNAPVSRAQAAVMINRALEFVSYDKETALDKTLKVEKFKDESKILEWARKDIETLLQAGIMEGLPNGNFDPYAQTTRSQMVKILDEALKTLKFINE